MEVGLEVELFPVVRDGGEAEADTVELLEVEALGEVVVEAGGGEQVGATADVLVAFGVGVEDAGFDDGVGGGGNGLGDDGGG